ncbi:MAG: RNA polymerase sigma factor [Verrucomicrobiales bacterium]
MPGSPDSKRGDVRTDRMKDADPTPPQLPASKSEEEAVDTNVIDVECMLRVKTGDVPAFEELVARHRTSVIGTIYRMLGDLDESHDLAQRVFIRVWSSAPRYEPSAKFTTWLFTITKNLVYNESRRRKRRPHYSLEAQAEDFHLAMPDTTAVEPGDALLHKEMQEAIDKAMEKLPDRQRMALVLRRFEHLPYEEIAKSMDLTVSSVKSLLFRARLQLREELRSYLEDT